RVFLTGLKDKYKIIFILYGKFIFSCTSSEHSGHIELKVKVYFSVIASVFSTLLSHI
ncbi:unnamed protein product, partial [marine sediment metagenome]